TVEKPGASTEFVFSFDAGTEVYVDPQPLVAGATNQGLRILRSRADATALRLLVEGLGGRTYIAKVRGPRRVRAIEGITVQPTSGGAELSIRFDGPSGSYVRRELTLPLTGDR